MSFLSPYAAFIALLVVAPLAAFVIADRGRRRVVSLLGLEESSRFERLGVVVAVTGIALALGSAAAQPTLVRHTAQRVRTDAEAWFVLDTSLSMTASMAPGAPSRFERSKAIARRLRDELADVPVGLASITDRALPHLFPSADRATFRATLSKVMGIERPPPTDGYSVRITTLGSLSRIASDNYFDPTTAHRLVVVFTDGETKPFVDHSLAALFQEPPGVKTIFVRCWNARERVYIGGSPDPLYHPDPRGARYIRELASATGGVALEENQFARLVQVARADLGSGPTQVVRREERRVDLAPYLAGICFLPLGFLLWRRNV